MTKQTNYVATVTDANSEFPPKGEAIPNSNRGLITATAGQTQGSVGAKDSWFIDTNAEPLASYPNNRLPRWQDLIPLSCQFTFDTSQVPVAPPATLDSTTALNIFYDGSGSMDQVLPTLQTMANTILKPCLLPFYNNNSTLYDQRVRVISISDERTIQWLGRAVPLNPSGANKVVNMTFANEVMPIYTPVGFTITNPPTADYITDINFTNSQLSANIRSITYRITYTSSPWGPLYEQLMNAVYTGTGSYGGDMGLSTNPYSTLIDNVDENGNAQYFANKVIEGLNLIGYNLSYC
jgi:hypothetical protein